MDVGRVAVAGGRVADLGTASVFDEGGDEGIGLSGVPAVDEHAGAGFLGVLGEGLDETRWTVQVPEVTVGKIELRQPRDVADRIGRDRLSVEVNRAVLEPPLEHHVRQEECLRRVANQIVDERCLLSFLRVVFEDDVAARFAMRIEQPVLLVFLRVAGDVEGRGERRELVRDESVE